MNYQNIYDNFIESRRDLYPSLSEKHHILPKSLGGTDDKCNIVTLSIGDHYFAHKLLTKIHSGKMWYTLHLMSRTRDGLRISRSDFETIRRNKAIAVSEIARNRTEDEKRIIGENINKAKKSQNFNHSDKTKAKISATKTGLKQTEESNRKRSLASKGKKKHHING